MPVVFELCKVSLYSAALFVLSDDSFNFSLCLLTAENVSKNLCFAGLKNDVALECAA